VWKGGKETAVVGKGGPSQERRCSLGPRIGADDAGAAPRRIAERSEDTRSSPRRPVRKSFGYGRSGRYRAGRPDSSARDLPSGRRQSVVRARGGAGLRSAEEQSASISVHPGHPRPRRSRTTPSPFRRADPDRTTALALPPFADLIHRRLRHPPVRPLHDPEHGIAHDQQHQREDAVPRVLDHRARQKGE
jgi:hypothetical protein